ncbi:uncharacterized protein LOC108908509 [Anoplophora glabripennis]|uniref:uncharacterized protein LOC108908509 n=1 Tax=Anoplophora glabripennis TaxID=217634 RepID=UPI000873D7CA|nr:uncharacterized protein LOC108908509 [Anoplophora glabripennis]
MSETFEPETGEMIVKRVSVPIGLEELMEGLTKEVLLKKPDDIYLFAADYFSRLLILRDKGAYKVKTQRNAQSVVKQTPKQPIEKLLVRGASKQLSRQISVRGESPTKKVPPVRKPLARMGREGKDIERNKIVDRRKTRMSEGIETKVTESKPKQVFATPRPAPNSNEEKDKSILNKRDRSLSSTRRGRSSSRNAQVTPRQKSTSTPRKTETSSESEKSGKISRGDDKHKLVKNDNKKEKPVVSQISSIEESQEYVKDGKLTVTSPKIVKHPKVSDSQEMINSIVVPQVVDHIATTADKRSSVNNINETEKPVEGSEKIAVDMDDDVMERKESLVRKDVADEYFNVSNEKKYKNGKEKHETNNHSGIDNKVSEENVKRIDSMSGENKNNSMQSDIDKIERSIKSDAEEIKSDETVSVELKPKSVKSNESSENTHEHNKSDQHLRRDHDETFPFANQNNNNSLESANRYEKVETKVTGNFEEENLELKTEGNEEADMNLKSEMESKINLTTSQDDSKEILRTEHLNSDIDNNQQNYSKSKIEREGNAAIISLNENETKTTEKEKLLEKIKSSDFEILDSTKIKENSKTESETGTQKDVYVSDEDHIKDDDKKEYSNQSNDSNNKKGQEDNVTSKNPYENKTEINDRELAKLKCTDPIISEIIDDNKIQEKFETGNGAISETMTQNDLHASEVDDTKKNSDSVTTQLIKERSNQQNELIVNKDEGSISKSSINENKTVISGEGKLKNEQFPGPAISELINSTTIEKNLELVPKTNSDIEKSKEREEKDKVAENTIDELDHPSFVSKVTPNTTNKEHPEKVAEKEKNTIPNDTTLKPGADDVEIIKTNCKIENKERIEGIENLQPLCKDEEDSGKLQGVEDKKLDSTSEDLKTENDSSVSLESDNKPEIDKPLNNLISQNTKEEKEEGESSTLSLKTDEINMPGKENSPTETNNIKYEEDEITALCTSTIDGADNIEKKKDIVKPVREKIEDKLKSDSDSSTEDSSNKLGQDIKPIEKINENDMQTKEKIDLDYAVLKSESQLKLDDHSIEGDKEKYISIPIDNSDGSVLKEGKTEITQLNISPSVESKERYKDAKLSENNILNKSQKEDDKNESYKENNGIKTTTVLDVKPDVSSDSYSTSTDEDITNKETTVSTTNTTDKDNSNDTSKDESNVQKSFSDSSIDQLDAKTAKIDDNSLEEDKGKHIIHQSEEDAINNISKSLEDNFSHRNGDKDSTTNAIRSVVSIAEGGSMDQRVKTYINNFIQNEKQHLFVGMSNIASGTGAELEKQTDEPFIKTNISDTMQEKHLVTNEILNKQYKKEENSHGGEENAIDHPLQELKDEETKNIINSTINVVTDGLLDHQVKSYINHFIQNEKQKVFIKNPDDITDDNVKIATTVDQAKEQIEDPSTIKSNEEDIIKSAKSVTEAKHPCDIDNKYITDFLQKETENVYIQDCDANKNLAIAIEKEIITSDNESNSKKHVNNSFKENNELEKKPESEKISEHNFSTESNMENIKETLDPKKTMEEDKKIRRIKTVDVIRDENKNKAQIKSRIPTADYRTRGKMDENEKHTRMKRSSSYSDNVRPPVENDTAIVDEKFTSTTNKGGVELLTKDLNKSVVTKEKKHDQEKAETVKEVEPAVASTSSSSEYANENQTKKINKEFLEDSNRSENSLKNTTSDFNLQHEGKNQDLTKNDDSQKEVAAARKNKAEIFEKRETADEVTGDKNEDMEERKEKKNKYQLDEAAVIIQKIWRGFKIRNEKGVKSRFMKDDEKVITNQTALDSAGTHKSTVLKLASKPEDEFIKAVTLIQKVWRGFRVRKLAKAHIDLKSGEKIATKDPNSRTPKETTSRNQNEVKTPQEIEYLKQQSENKFVEAAILIQKIWRGFKVRKPLKNNTKQIIDGKKTKDSVIPLSEKDIKYDMPNVEISKKQIATENATNQESTDSKSCLKSEEFIKAAVLIQKIWRGFRVRKQSKIGFKLKNSQNNEREEPISKNVGEVAKGQNEIKISQGILQLKSQGEDEFVKAAMLIQKIWRGFKVRKLFKLKQEIVGKKKTDSEVSVNGNDSKSSVIKEGAIAKQITGEGTKIQETTKLQSSLKSEDEFTKAAILIQKIWRGFKVRNLTKNKFESKHKEQIITEKNVKISNQIGAKPLKETTHFKQSQRENEFVKAAVLIQKIWRGFKVRKQIELNMKDRTDSKIDTDLPIPTASIKTEEEFNKAAVLIQKNWKGFKVRNLSKRESKLINDVDNVHKKQNNTFKDGTLTKQVVVQENEEQFVKAAILIQKFWRGFKVRNTLKKKSENNSKPEKSDYLKSIVPKEAVLIKQIIAETASPQSKQQEGQNKSKENKKIEGGDDKLGIKTSELDDESVKAAIMIQKIWRGFNVRKVRQQTEVFGKPVNNEKPAIETVREIDPKDKKSALKIQSLWRGYQVRKNINVIKNKLEDTITSNDAGKGKELTDGDILNAATKIQAGVRGYLQRKKFKNDINKLNSISEEGDKGIYNATVKEGDGNGCNVIDRKLSEEEVLKALEDLNKLKVPNDIPILHEIDKPKFYRSDTVQEPQFERKHNPPLLKSNSVNYIPIKDASTSSLLNIDDNNNANKFNKSPLGIKVQDARDHVAGENLNKLTNEEIDLNRKIINANNIDRNTHNVHQKLNTNKEDSIHHNKLDLNQIPQLHDCDNSVTHDNESSIKKSSTNNVADEEENHINPVDQEIANILMAPDVESSMKISKNVSEENLNNINPQESTKVQSNLNLPYNLQEKTNKNISVDTKGDLPIIDKEIDSAPPGYDENKYSNAEKNIYERPLSMDSNDSVVTVIYKDIPDNKSEFEDNEVNVNVSDKIDTKSNETLSEQETLIGDLQNKLLDQICGRNDTLDETVDKFDIEQLRKELEETGLIYNTDDNSHIRHENSRELLDDHDQLLDYLEGYELSTQGTYQT